MSAASAPKLPPTPLERSPRPELGTARIPKERYTQRAFATREWERMWTRTWLLAGFESDIPEPGDYFTFEIGIESILVIRQRDGSIGARYNVCLHRGNRLREPGRGHAELFSCLFHGWQYDIDGRLLRPLDPESFPQGCDGLDLRPVRCDTWAGFVFLCLDADAEPLRDYLGVIPEHLDPYHFEEWKIAYDATIEIECNWKTCVDAFNEAYHLSATHAWTISFTDDLNTEYDCYDKHTRMIFPEVQASPRHAGAGTVTPGIRDMFLKRVGVDVESFEGGPDAARAAFAEAIRKLGPPLGADFSELNESQMCDDFHYTIFPNVTFNIFGRSAWLFRHRPHPSDPNRMYFDLFNLVRLPNAEMPRAEHEFHVSDDDFRLDLVGGGGDLLAQDTYNLPRIQQGMHSAGFEGLHLGDQELRIRHFHSVLDRYLDDAS